MDHFPHAVQRALAGKEFAVFNVLLTILRTPDTARKLPCFRPAQISGSDRRYRSAFIACWRLLLPAERRHARHELMWHLYDPRAEPVSFLHDSWYALEHAPEDDPHFREFCRLQGLLCLSAFEVFLRIVTCGRDLSRQAFQKLWAGINPRSQASLLAEWWLIINCGCDCVQVGINQGETVFLVRLTPGSSLITL